MKLPSHNFTPWFISEKNRNPNLKRYMYPNVHSSNIYNSQDIKATSPSTDKKKIWCEYIYIYIYIMKYYLLSHKKGR